MNEMVKKGYDLRISLDADTRFLARTSEYDFEMNDIC